MKLLSVRDFRSNLSTTLNQASEGEKIYIRRNNQLFAIIPIETNDLDYSITIQEKIEKARQEFISGETLGFESATKAQQWMDEL